MDPVVQDRNARLTRPSGNGQRTTDRCPDVQLWQATWARPSRGSVIVAAPDHAQRVQEDGDARQASPRAVGQLVPFGSEQCESFK